MNVIENKNFKLLRFNNSVKNDLEIADDYYLSNLYLKHYILEITRKNAKSSTIIVLEIIQYTMQPLQVQSFP